MAEPTVVHLGENSPEHVAYQLMRTLALVEDKLFNSSEANPQKVASRKWILDTYAECLMTVKSPHARLGQTNRA
jgi:hypothetical protein